MKLLADKVLSGLNNKSSNRGAFVVNYENVNKVTTSLTDMSDSSEDSNKDFKNVYSLLHYASASGDYDIFDFVLKNCKDLQHSLFDTDGNVTGETPLHFAVSKNNLEIAAVLIHEMRRAKDEEIDHKDNDEGASVSGRDNMGISKQPQYS